MFAIAIRATPPGIAVVIAQKLTLTPALVRTPGDLINLIQNRQGGFDLQAGIRGERVAIHHIVARNEFIRPRNAV
jgi:hypothetical protein